ncbi:RDD family protein [Salibaculum griseiflavum]|uniref:RDD family protein n=1 Tax=Salibaculum griseiflavum TaxID=1914409 RepID=A0A2V1P862_9RHOB|nr:RDD family protein [Salibaculum griseiflavum]PWG18681.1 RDD family protein [Salibaculum griseiflavum]
MIGRPANILPPEAVPIRLEIASGGARFGAQALDILITFGGLFLLFWALIWANVLDWSMLATLFFLLVFLIRVPYYILSELVWNGRTIGKRIVRIKVISADGQRLTPHQIVARNLMKEVEVFMPATTLLSGSFQSGWVGLALTLWMILVLCVPLFNKRRQRLGDMIAGTLVVDQPTAVLLPDLAATQSTAGVGFVFQPEQLDVYGRFELQTLEQILRNRPKTEEQRQRVSDVVHTIRRKIKFEEDVAARDEWDFLTDFYRQQREFLESRHLFGDTREDKFHKTGS